MLNVSLPRTGGRGGRGRVGNIPGSPPPLILDLTVAGQKVAAFLFIPVHRTTFLGAGGFLINKHKVAVDGEINPHTLHLLRQAWAFFSFLDLEIRAAF